MCHVPTKGCTSSELLRLKPRALGPAGNRHCVMVPSLHFVATFMVCREAGRGKELVNQG